MRRFVVFLLALASTAAAHAPGAHPAPAPPESAETWIAWNDRLETVRGSLVSLDAETLRLRDAMGRVVEVPGRRLVALMLDAPVRRTGPIVPEPGPGLGGRFAVVTLTDGQRWPCVVLMSDAHDDLRVRVSGVGQASLQLDVVRSVRFKPGPGRGVPGSADRVVLGNGDVIEGTVLSIGRSVQIEGAGSVADVPLGAVASIDLVNPATEPAPMRVWMSDGAVFAAQSLRGDSEASLRCEAIAPSSAGWNAFGEIRVWDPSAGRSPEGVELAPGRLVPWSSLEIASFDPESGRRWTPPPRVERDAARMGLAGVELSGPMRVTWRLPRRAVLASATATLGEQPGAWADCIVRVEQQGRVLWEQRLNGESPHRSFVVELDPAREITLRVLPGAYGPIEDRVRLELGWVLLDPGGESG